MDNLRMTRRVAPIERWTTCGRSVWGTGVCRERPGACYGRYCTARRGPAQALARRRTISAYRDGEKIVVLLPARTTKADERQLVAEMVSMVTRREQRRQLRGARSGDSALMARAADLSRNYLGGHAQPASVRWVRNMSHRWGSCTPADRTIRLSHRLQSMPSWVIDYVLIHELSHLLESGHGPRFWAWVDRYPRTERARGYLEGLASAAQLPDWSSCEPPETSGLDSAVSDAAVSDSAVSDAADVSEEDAEGSVSEGGVSEEGVSEEGVSEAAVSDFGALF